MRWGRGERTPAAKARSVAGGNVWAEARPTQNQPRMHESLQVRI